MVVSSLVEAWSACTQELGIESKKVKKGRG